MHQRGNVPFNRRFLRICFVCNELPPAVSGGIGPCVFTLARALASAGHDVVVVGLYEREYDWSNSGFRVVPLTAQKRRSMGLARFSGRWALRRTIASLNREARIDVVEWPDFQGEFLFALRSGPVDVLRNHGPSLSHRLYGLIPRDRTVEMREVWTLRRIPNWIGVSHWFMHECAKFANAKPKRATVVYNPVDCDVFHPEQLDRDKGLILYAGSLMERKGAFALAKAARLFLPQLPEARLLFVGREAVPGARKRIVELAGERATHQIQFLDPLDQQQLAKLMRRCAVFAMPSILESFGNVWAEAMASGTPVLGSRLTCGPEVVPHEQAGLLVDPANHQQIADALIQLMRHEALRTRLGNRGRSIAVERYSVQSASAKTLDFYRQCLLV